MPECETTAPALLDRDGTSVRCLLYAPGFENAAAAKAASGPAVHQDKGQGEQARETAQ